MEMRHRDSKKKTEPEILDKDIKKKPNQTIIPPAVSFSSSLILINFRWISIELPIGLPTTDHADLFETIENSYTHQSDINTKHNKNLSQTKNEGAEKKLPKQHKTHIDGLDSNVSYRTTN